MIMSMVMRVSVVMGLALGRIEGEGVEEGALVPGDLGRVAGEAAGRLGRRGRHEDQSLHTGGHNLSTLTSMYLLYNVQICIQIQVWDGW